MTLLSIEGGRTFDSADALTHNAIEEGALLVAVPVLQEVSEPHSPDYPGNMIRNEDLEPLAGTVREKIDYPHLGGGLIFLAELANKKNIQIRSTHSFFHPDGKKIHRTLFFAL